ncbi:MAG: mechanosensitive ion channel domain-containing protein [Acidobacteriota bacterium]|nr:mechanosensitive ion channel domain-containing protein [Acidobacteriota bacterium]
MIENWLVAQNLDATLALVLTRVIAYLFVIILSVVANLVAKRVILSIVRTVVSRTRTGWDDVLVQRRVFSKLSHLAPALVLYTLMPLALEGYGLLSTLHTSAALIYMILVGVLVLDSLLNAVHDIYGTFEISREIPIKSFLQILKIGLYFVSGIFVLSIILDRTPLYFLSGLGALTAVLMLVFKDAILGFVAGIQLTANRMVAQGDWIEMPRYGADGNIVEVTLTTVKVQNWDKTITTVPTYALISQSFKNWSGMEKSGGRRIKRALHIDMNSIRFCSEEMIQRFSRIQYIAAYVETKRTELAEHNRSSSMDDSSLANGRRMTNIGTFRAYIEAYLANHPMVSQEMTFLVRQLAPGEHGLPIEIYVFCTDVRWAHYEAIQADIFDHVLAVLPEFDLRVFQSLSGGDLQAFTTRSASG